MKKLFIIGILLGGILLLVNGCTSKPQLNTSTVGYEVKDSQGYVLKLPKKPSRIVSLSLGADEILLGLVSKERILALTYLADDPSISNVAEQAKLIPKKVKGNAESIIALQPDLLFIADWQPVELIQILREAGIPVYVYKTPQTIEDVKVVIHDIAHAVGEEQLGQQLVTQMEEQLLIVQKSLEKVSPAERKTVVLFSLMGGIGGKGSLFDDICQYACVVNGASKVGVRKHEFMSKEQVVEAKPDVLIMSMEDYTGKRDVNQFKREIQTDPAFQTLPAIKEQQLFMIPDTHLTCTSQYIVQGVADVAKAAYPQYSKP
ncbi:MAG: ABC-type transporter, periplasmic subunit [Pelosinus sp.]|jgi:iron complex transport system substrate-binding protein|nr:ABC-type transporter, periplasmic subunit [Pelosinus sp.]